MLAVTRAAKSVDGVTDVFISLEAARAEIRYDATKTSPEAIAAAITKSGMTARVATSATTPRAAGSPPNVAAPIEGLSVDHLRERFNAAVNSTRIVSILSPMCPACQGGQGVLGRVFAETTTDRLKGYVVWLSMKPGDSLDSARHRAAAFTDPRVTQGWDASGAIGDQFAKALALKGRAWDVYAVYAPGVKWTDATPPAPTFWMHQLTEAAGADQALCLNPATLLREVRKIVGAR